MPKRFLILYNPASGRRRPQLTEAVAAELERRGQSVVLDPTTGPGDAQRLLLAHADEFDVVVAAGGDGTLHEVINGLLGKEHRPLGVIPSGTTNVFAKELALPTEPMAIVDMLLAGKTKAVYPNQLNGERFLLWVGAGFDAWVVAGVDLGLKKRIGKAAYVLQSLRSLPTFGTRRYLIHADDQELDAYSVIVSSGRLYGGRFELAKDADLARPDLQVALFQSPSKLTLARNLVDLAIGRFARSPDIKIVTAKEIRIERIDMPAGQKGTSKSPGAFAESLQVDGDPGTNLPAEIHVEETPISVLVP